MKTVRVPSYTIRSKDVSSVQSFRGKITPRVAFTQTRSRPSSEISFHSFSKNPTKLPSSTLQTYSTAATPSNAETKSTPSTTESNPSPAQYKSSNHPDAPLAKRPKITWTKQDLEKMHWFDLHRVGKFYQLPDVTAEEVAWYLECKKENSSNLDLVDSERKPFYIERLLTFQKISDRTEPIKAWADDTPVIEVLYAAVPLYSKPSHVEPYQLHEVNYRLLKANIETLGQLKTFIANKPIEEFNKLVLYPKVSGKVQQALKDDQLQRGCVYLEKSQRKVVNRIERLNRKQRKERAKLKRKSEKQQLTDKQKAEQEKLVQEKLAQERLQKQKEQQQMSQDIKQQVLQSLKDPSTLLSQNESSK